MGQHGAYIVASYIATAIILGGIVLTSLVAHRAASRRLGLLEKGKSA